MSLDGRTDAGEEHRATATSALPVWFCHAFALFLALGSLMVFIGPGVYTIDEAAYSFQADAVTDGRWGLPYPTEGLIEQDIGGPLVNAELSPSQWYPAARYPAYVQLVRGSMIIGGSYGPVLLSVIGIVLAALGIERLSRWLGGAPNWSGFWLAGLASPAAFHGLVAWAHAPALGLVATGLAMLLVGAASDHRSTIAGTVCLSAAVLLRGDAPIMMIAVIMALVVGAVFDRRYVSRAIAVTLGSAFAYGLNTVLHGLVVDSGAVSGTGTGRGLDVGRYAHATFEILLSPSSGGLGTFRLIAVLLLPVAVVWVRRNGEHDVATAYVLAGLAVVAGVIGSLQPASYGALLPAFPLLMLGVAGLGFGQQNSSEQGLSEQGLSEQGLAEQGFGAGWQRVAILVVAAAAATVGPILASASGGGGLGWGGRYVLLSLVATVPLVASGCGALWRQSETRPLLLAALVLTAAVQVSGVRTLHAYHRLSLVATEEITAGLLPLPDEVDLIIAVDARVGRLSPDIAASIPLISAPDDDAARELLTVAGEQGLRQVAIVSYTRQVTLELPSPWREIAYRDEPLQVLMVTR